VPFGRLEYRRRGRRRDLMRASREREGKLYNRCKRRTWSFDAPDDVVERERCTLLRECLLNGQGLQIPRAGAAAWQRATT
jgi:hypothetical protein